MKKNKRIDNKVKKFLSIFLSVVIAISVFIPVVVYAATGTAELEVELLQEGDFGLPDSQSTSANDTSSYTAPQFDDASQEFLYNELLNCSKSFSLYSFKIHKDDFRDIYCNVINDNPDLFYVSSSVNYSYYRASGYIATVYPEYTMDATDIESAKVVFNNGVEKALSVVDDTMTDLQKALVIHDYICDKATYPYDAVDNDNSNYHSAYGFFYDQKIVCAGYALAYSHLLHRLGIECEYVTSSAMMHAWNIVKIDGEWYNVDLTFDDISFYNKNMNVRGAMLHRCFMKSDKALYGEMGFYHYGGSTLDACDLSDTTYDTYFWNDVNTNIYVLNGNYYYLDVNPTDKTDVLVKRTVDGKESKVGSTKFSYTSVSATETCTDGNGVEHSVSFSDPLCRLTYLDNRFYITNGKYIVSYSYINNKYKMNIIYQDSNYNLMGLGSDENGNLVCQRRTDYKTISLDKDEYFKKHLTTESDSSYNNYVDINLDGFVNAKDYFYISRGTTK